MKTILSIVIYLSPLALWAQQSVDSMFVNLYTDSLKVGTYNYINVDGRLHNGRYTPLDSSQVIFKASDGRFSGNSLWLAPGFEKDKVTITVILKSDTSQHKTFDIYIKKTPDPDLKTEKEILEKMQQPRKSRTNRRTGRA